MKLYEVNGTYGSGKTPCTVFVADKGQYSSAWYCVQGSVNVNKTPDPIEDGVNVEEVFDIDTFTASKPINSLKDLEHALNN
jgi:hypothetical protein